MDNLLYEEYLTTCDRDDRISYATQMIAYYIRTGYNISIYKGELERLREGRKPNIISSYEKEYIQQNFYDDIRIEEAIDEYNVNAPVIVKKITDLYSERKVIEECVMELRDGYLAQLIYLKGLYNMQYTEVKKKLESEHPDMKFHITQIQRDYKKALSYLFVPEQYRVIDPVYWIK